ncbi:MAG: class I SAM-dependent methyltransferase, partial [Dehalococcoidia bacterium]|nr:class I SAM-dependent methyltransferase [Dehalococcoidia bacterium]
MEINPFDESYFDGGPGSIGYGSYTDSWIWAPMTEVILHLTSEIGPILDWGCAKGHLIHRLLGRGIDAVGVDVSEYALSQVHPDIVSRVRLIDGVQTRYRRGHFETVLSFETLEHVLGDQIPLVVEEIRRVTKRWFFGT